MDRIVYGSYLNPRSPGAIEMLRDGVMTIDESGVIASLKSAAGQPVEKSRDSTLDFSGYLILPGFVDCHAHISQVRAVNVRYAELIEWLSRVVFPLEENYSRRDAEHEAPGFFTHLLSTGTTTSALYVTIDESATDEVFGAAERAGVRAVIGKVMMDRHSPPGLLEDTGESIDASVRLAEKWHMRDRGRLRYAFTPRFALTCSMNLMRAAGDWARKLGCHVMTHVAENPVEVRRARELFPECESYLSIYRDAGLLMPGAILGHAIYLSDRDWELVRASGAGIAHCPISNLLLESGILDLDAALRLDIGIGLGSDIGAGSEPALSEVAEAAITSQIARKVLGHSHRLVSPELALYLLTMGGAKAMGLGDIIGDLSQGKDADFVVLDPRPCLPLGEWPDDLDPASLLYALLLQFRTEAVKAVFVRGKQVYPPGISNEEDY